MGNQLIRALLMELERQDTALNMLPSGNYEQRNIGLQALPTERNKQGTEISVMQPGHLLQKDIELDGQPGRGIEHLIRKKGRSESSMEEASGSSWTAGMSG